MVVSCCVRGCTNRFGYVDISFHRFPANLERRRSWMKAIRGVDDTPKSSGSDWQPTVCGDRVCGAHFETGSANNDKTHPDFVPHLNMGHHKDKTCPDNIHPLYMGDHNYERSCPDYIPRGPGNMGDRKTNGDNRESQPKRKCKKPNRSVDVQKKICEGVRIESQILTPGCVAAISRMKKEKMALQSFHGTRTRCSTPPALRKKSGAGLDNCDMPCTSAGAAQTTKTPPHSRDRCGGKGRGKKRVEDRAAMPPLLPIQTKLSNHQCILHSSMVSLWQNKELCDTILLTQDQQFRTHRLVLAASSQTLHSLFAYQKVETGEITHIINMEIFGISSAEVLKAIIEFIYNGKTNISREKYTDLMQAASILKLQSLLAILKELSDRYVIKNEVIDRTESSMKDMNEESNIKTENSNILEDTETKKELDSNLTGDKISGWDILPSETEIDTCRSILPKAENVPLTPSDNTCVASGGMCEESASGPVLNVPSLSELIPKVSDKEEKLVGNIEEKSISIVTKQGSMEAIGERSTGAETTSSSVLTVAPSCSRGTTLPLATGVSSEWKVDPQARAVKVDTRDMTVPTGEGNTPKKGVNTIKTGPAAHTQGQKVVQLFREVSVPKSVLLKGAQIIVKGGGREFVLTSAGHQPQPVPEPVNTELLCDVCGHVSTSKMQFQNHKYYYHFTGRVECKECGKTFDRTSTLNRHTAYVHKRKRRMCDICGITINSLWFSSHMKVHCVKRLHECSVCGKGFKGRNGLKVHEMRHTGKKWTCEYCGKIYSFQSGLQGHLADKHKDMVRKKAINDDSEQHVPK